MTEYADDHIPANPRPEPLRLERAPPPGPSLEDMIQTARACSTRERAAKAGSLENEALQMERRADAGADDAAALRQTAAELRAVAEAIKPPWGEA